MTVRVLGRSTVDAVVPDGTVSYRSGEGLCLALVLVAAFASPGVVVHLESPQPVEEEELLSC